MIWVLSGPLRIRQIIRNLIFLQTLDLIACEFQDFWRVWATISAKCRTDFFIQINFKLCNYLSFSRLRESFYVLLSELVFSIWTLIGFDE